MNDQRTLALKSFDLRQGTLSLTSPRIMTLSFGGIFWIRWHRLCNRHQLLSPAPAPSSTVLFIKHNSGCKEDGYHPHKDEVQLKAAMRSMKQTILSLEKDGLVLYDIAEKDHHF
ncbi:hypothetical protein LOAG_04815 [Loa loa]|uniref:Uncharacterized protein n=1 Tax=Loa loa TaxID=7209 RepID=A0A1S0U311_LOALO|nr:hypothetical protein LOAG_04815 [Loa loa]EFO23670.1 hypothetical protein LOAG_04815 [Loa loa]